MWVKSYKLYRNVNLPDYIIEELRRNITNLKIKIENRLGCSYNIELKFSVQSEAAYFTISRKPNTYKISIRNHTTRNDSFNKAYFLSDYYTWEEFESYFIEKELQQIKGILKSKRISYC